MPQSLSISIPSNEKNSIVLDNFIDSFISAFALPDELFARITVSMHSAFENCVRYGNLGDESKMVTVFVKKTSSRLIVTISDEGNGFNCRMIPNPTTQDSLDRECGNGLFVMKTLSDKLIFKNGGAKIVMTYNLPCTNFFDKLLKSLFS